MTGGRTFSIDFGEENAENVDLEVKIDCSN